MCGIAGIISPHSPLIQSQRLQLMADALQHRGPDSEGFWTNAEKTIGFTHRRLCILDLSSAAAQPFHYLHYTLVFNGEIYNYIELKKELQSVGYTFTTATDTEVIPAAYDHWGENCLQHFDGMFAFALYDARQQDLFIARDRFGEKPLYYYPVYTHRGRFEQVLFASEIKALLAAGVNRRLNGTMMLNYIALGYVQNPIKKTETFYSNILSLPPGNCLSIIPAGGKIRMRKWYRPALPTIAIDENEAVKRFAALFAASVEKRLRSDVPVGTSLSGGLESSSIVATIHQLKTAMPHWTNVAFTAAFNGFEKDEATYSKEVANTYSIQQYFTHPTADDWIKNWQELVYYQDEPVQSSSVLTQYLVYKLAKEKNITVLLDGQGADEILGGYKKYVHWYLQQLLLQSFFLFKKEKKALQKNHFLQQWNWKNYIAAWYPRKAAQHLQQEALQQIHHHTDFNAEFVMHYQNKDTLTKPVVRQLEDLLYYNTFTFGLEELLRYADRNSMAHSREVRLPFLQHDLVEFIFALPAGMKIKDGFTKWMLRKSMDAVLPKNICWRKDKIGYEPPQQQWMQDKRIQEMIYESKKKLIAEKVLNENVLHQKVQPKGAHEKDNFDFRYVSAAAMIAPI
jgi:asparagine synthase (glutamine-hydrolysing)